MSVAKALNLIFIMFDDMRPELSIYKQHHMITPNFERLASKSVVFDKAFAQISVCNPSRDSILTGLRPDTTGTYSFQSSYRPHLSLPMHLARSNYSTATYGKIFHWEIDDKAIWNVEMYDNKWYEYQNNERGWMNSSTMPDKIRSDFDFKDYDYTSKAIDRLEKFIDDKSKPFMISLGFKYPHLQYHVPYKYYKMYLNKTDSWKLTKKELRYPHSAPDVGYRCCAEPFYKYMIAEGSINNREEIQMGDINMPFTERMRDELMLGYCAAITFVDIQLGRLLDVLDKSNAWENTVVIVTSDHGHHNGEKGIWEKWSFFDESNRVPLLIHHPHSPYMGQHYPEPVELVDLYPTIVDLLNVDYIHSDVCHGTVEVGRDFLPLVCHDLQGKSLARVILGDRYYKEHVENNPRHLNNLDRYSKQSDERMKLFDTHYQKYPTATNNMHQKSDLNLNSTNTESIVKSNQRLLRSNDMNSETMPLLDQRFAISQSWRCAKISDVKKHAFWYKSGSKGDRPYTRWFDCDKTVDPENNDQVSVMGYSLRTSDFRYNAWFQYDRKRCLPILDKAPFDEELYDHRGEKLEDFTHLEVINMAHRPAFQDHIVALRMKLVHFVKTVPLFRGCFNG